MKRAAVITISLVMVAVLVFLGYRYIWSGSRSIDNDVVVELPVEYLRGSELVFENVFIDSNSNFAITSDGKTYAWGYNATGVLGVGDRQDRNIPVPINGLNGLNVIKISKGYSYAIALTDDGALYGWGIKPQTLLGATSFPVLSPIKLDVTLPSKIIDIAAGQDHVVVLTESGQLFTWGEGNYGNLGTGKMYEVAESPMEIAAFSDSPIVQLAVNTFTTVAVNEDGEVFIWGVESFSQEEQEYIKEPTKIEALAGIRITQVSLGRCFAALSAEGNVYTWGKNLFGECGVGDNDPHATPQLVEGLENVVQVFSTSSHMLALTGDGRTFAWGYNNRGQTGAQITQSLSSTFIITPTEIELLADKSIVKIFAGQEYSLALAADGKIYSWGYGKYGQLGRGQDADNTIIPTPTGLEQFVK